MRMSQFYFADITWGLADLFDFPLTLHLAEDCSSRIGFCLMCSYLKILSNVLQKFRFFKKIYLFFHFFPYLFYENIFSYSGMAGWGAVQVLFPKNNDKTGQNNKQTKNCLNWSKSIQQIEKNLFFKNTLNIGKISGNEFGFGSTTLQ